MVAQSPYVLQLPNHRDNRGGLFFGQMPDQWDFEVKRIYFCDDFNDGTTRGGHAHKQLDQVIVCVSGSFDIMTDNGAGERHVWQLGTTGQALRIYSPTWREIISKSDDAIYLCLASECYDAGDYIRDYESFVHYVRQGKC